MNTALQPCRVTSDLNRHEIAEAQGSANSDTELLKAAQAALKWFKEEPTHCLIQLEERAKDETAALEVLRDIAGELLEAIISGDKSKIFIATTSAYTAWMVYALTDHGFDSDEITRALELLGPCAWEAKS